MKFLVLKKGEKIKCKRLILYLGIVFFSIASPVKGVEKGDGAVSSSIVKIYVTQSGPDYLNPWRSGGNEQISGSGCVISKKRILTNAHVVADAKFIEVRLHGQSKRYKAKVMHVAHEVDLALLTVEDSEFFDGLQVLELGGLPKSQQEVLVYGFPIGGDSLSITKGILSRIEHQSYVHSGGYYLAGQIDAAINPGNSGGPVIVNGKIAGVVMQSYSPLRSESLGYMVPSPVVRHFLSDLEDGHYDAFPAIGIETQDIENPDMKRMFGMRENQTGIVINYIHFNSPAKDILKENDILMKIDGHVVADNGTVEFRPKERTYYSYFIEMHQMEEKVSLEILRKSKIKKVNLKLNNKKDDFLLVPNKQYDKLPRYFIFGGIVFSPLTKNIVEEWGRGWRHRAPDELIHEISNRPDEDKAEVVVALKVLPVDLNRGYHEITNWVVDSVNDKKFKDFGEFYSLVSESREPFVVFKNAKGRQLVIDREKEKESRDEILKTYRIGEDRSEDLK